MWFLVKEKGLPEELELITLDLWALRIAQFGDRIASDGRADSQSQSQVFNTLETDESDTDDGRVTLRTSKRRNKKLGEVPNLLDCLALCYLGMLTLRLPITLGDIYHWVTEEKLPYRGAVKLLPLPMRDRLPGTYHAMLNPNALLKFRRLYATITDLQVSFTKDHKITWAALNYRLLIFRYIKELALPIEIYDFTIRLSKLLGFDFVLPHDSKGRLGVRHVPEAQLAGCLVVCIRILYPFDTEKRHPRSAAEPTAIVMNWENWQQQIQHAKAGPNNCRDRYTVEELTRLEEKDVFDMSTDRLDQYLDFYAGTFLDDAEIQRTRDTDDFRNAIYGMFPIGDSSPQPSGRVEGSSPKDDLSTVRAVHSSMHARSAIADDEVGAGVLRPGQSYHIYKKEKDLPEHAKVLYEEVAKLQGLSMDMLIMAVLSVEARIEQWRRKQDAPQ